MVKSHPQWLRVKALIDEGRIGELRAVMGAFSYYNVDPTNIRNHVDHGGGALLDIGCYLVLASRYGFGQEPLRVVSSIDHDPKMKIDRLTSAILEFEGGHAVFTCSMQFVPYQKVQFFGSNGRIEIEIPFNAPKDEPTRIYVDDGKHPGGRSAVVEEIPVCDQYTLQGDEFSKAVIEDGEVPVPVEEAIRNMKVIEAIFHSAETGTWQKIAP